MTPLNEDGSSYNVTAMCLHVPVCACRCPVTQQDDTMTIFMTTTILITIMTKTAMLPRLQEAVSQKDGTMILMTAMTAIYDSNDSHYHDEHDHNIHVSRKVPSSESDC